jgi:starch phosphorylase
MATLQPFEHLNVGPIDLFGGEQALYERHLTFDHVVALERATPRDKFEAIARSIRDALSQRWLATERAHQEQNVKRVYYVSLEFLMGRALANNITNLMFDSVWRDFCSKHGIDPLETIEEEPDAGLGNGGLGRLAACFLDSMATLGIPGMGSGLRYEYGIFKQSIRDGWQHEQPDHWLARPDPWEVARPGEAVEVRLACSFDIHQGALRAVRNRPSMLIGVPYDRPVVGYGAKTINTLRLWSAATPDYFDFQQFSTGDFVGALAETLTAETVTRVLYPDDSTAQGQGLRFVQQYFLVACTLADAVRRFRAAGNDWLALPDKIALQMNDTHPTLAVAELMRILLDEAGLGWDVAWDLTVRTLAYTNHTLLPEALEKWPLPWFEMMLPRQLEIILVINHRFLDVVRQRFPGDDARQQRMSLIEEGQR